jgi:hypothetical protein
MATLNTNAEKAYQAGFTPLLQQTMSKLRGLITVKNFSNAEEWYMNQIGEVSVSEVADLTQATVLSSATTARRQITKSNYYYHELVLDDHLNDMSFDPKSDIVSNILRGFARNADDLIIAAAQADANTGKNGGTTTSFPGGNTIAHGSTGMTYAKILEGVEKFLEGDFEGDRVSLIVGPKQATELLNIDKFIDNDFNRVQASDIVSPMLSGYLGSLKLGIAVDIFTSARLAVDTDIRDCLMFSRNGIGLGIGAEPTVKFVTRGDLNSQTQISVGAIMGASRLDEEQVYVLECDES